VTFGFWARICSIVAGRTSSEASSWLLMKSCAAWVSVV
jgi:hypothetical protein